jgi:hypothetical protein
VIPNNDNIILSYETLLRNVIDSSRNVKGLAERHVDSEITTLTIQTSPKWKYDLAREAITLQSKGFDFRSKGTEYLKSLPIFKNEQIRGEIFQTWTILTIGTKKKRGKIFTWAEDDKNLITNMNNESEFLSSNINFISKELGLDFVTIYSVGEGEDVAGKARLAFPLEPGIAFT